QFAQQRQPLLRRDLWFIDDRLKEHARAVHEILAADADKRIECERVPGGLFRYAVRRGQSDAILGAGHVFPPLAGIRSPAVSAIRAGFSDPSTSSVFCVFMIICPPSLGSTPRRTTRSRTRAPAGTGARKRTLSIP